MEAVGLRIPYVRDLMESVHRRERSADARLALRLPERLRRHLTPDRLQPGSVDASIPLDEGEELLLAIDEALGDGSGRVLEEAAFELALRGLLRGTLGVLVGADFVDTLARMQAALERPFCGVQVAYELERTETSLELSVGIASRPRAARILRHLSTGTVRAVHQFMRAGDPNTLRILGEVTGGRARLSIRYRPPSTPTETEPTPPSFSAPPRRASRDSRPGGRTLSAEIERILVSTRASLPPPREPRRSSGDALPAVRLAVAQPQLPDTAEVRRPSGSLARVKPPAPASRADPTEEGITRRADPRRDEDPPTSARPSRPPSVPPAKR